MVTLYVGSQEPTWLGRATFPLMVSYRRMIRRPTHRPAVTPWILDSGAFTELAAHGRFVTPAPVYALAAATFAAELGRLEWASPQDWMCEPAALAATGLDVADHQARTIASVLELRDLAPGVPWAPVLQGWTLRDYLAHVDAYERAGIDLEAEPIVGVGTMCKREGSDEIARLIDTLAGRRLRLHAFGVKTAGIRRLADALVSADSMAWSYGARRRAGNPNAYATAERWHAQLANRIAGRLPIPR